MSFPWPLPKRRAGNKILVIGGGGPDQEVYNDVHIFDVETKEWSSPKIEGTPLTPCWGQTATSIDDNRVLIFGGHTGEGMLSEFRLLNLETMAWEIPVIQYV